MLKPRGDRDAYEKTMLPIFALMCFTEGCPVPCKTPFLDANGNPVAPQSQRMLPRLSMQGMDILHGKSVSTFIKPPEEVFICLTLAKFILSKLQGLDVNVDEFRVGNPPQLPVCSYKAKTNDGYDQTDINFFYEHIQRVVEIMKEDRAKPMKERWMVFDYPERNASSPSNLDKSDKDNCDLDNAATIENHVSNSTFWKFDDSDEED